MDVFLRNVVCVYSIMMFSICNRSAKVSGNRGRDHLGRDSLIDCIYFIVVFDITLVVVV